MVLGKSWRCFDCLYNWGAIFPFGVPVVTVLTQVVAIDLSTFEVGLSNPGSVTLFEAVR